MEGTNRRSYTAEFKMDAVVPDSVGRLQRRLSLREPKPPV